MNDQAEPTTTATPVSPATPGEWLAQERVRQGRTVQQIAADLHLGVYMIEAMESNRFAVLGAPVFARGHLRKYATLLGLPIERAQELYQRLGDTPRAEDPVPSLHRASEPSIPMSPDSKERRALKRPALWNLLIVGVALVVCAFLAWLFLARSKHEPKVVTSQVAVASEPVESVTEPAAENSLATSDGNAVAAVQLSDSTRVSTTMVATKEQRANNTAADRNVVSVARGKVRLRFAFTQESWVEVYDVHGTRMLYDVGQSGQTRSVDVDAPAQIVLGLATAVTTEANGRVVAVPSRHVVNQVARFAVGADGVAQ